MSSDGNRKQFYKGRGNWGLKNCGRGSFQEKERGYWKKRKDANESAANKHLHETSTANQVPLNFRDNKYSQPVINTIFKSKPVPVQYKGSYLYHPQENFMEGSPTVNKTIAAERFCRRHKNLFVKSEIEERRSFTLDYKILTADETFLEEWSDFQEDLSNNPEHCISCFGLAVHQFVLTELEKEANNGEEDVQPLDLPIIRVRFANYEPITQLRNLKANCYGL